MEEIIEFRLHPEFLAQYLPEAEGIGRDLAGGFVRQAKLRADDPLVAKIGRVDRELRASGKRKWGLFAGWDIRRKYSAQELDGAALFHVRLTSIFEPAGEECGTKYDESKAFSDCGAGAPQLTELHLDGRRIPLSADFSRTISGEVVVSRRVPDLFREAGLVGADFRPIILANKGGVCSDSHFQLVVTAPQVELGAATRAGGDPFDESSQGRCPGGHVVGLSLLSEVSVQGSSVPEADLMTTRQMIGGRRGLLRPQPILLISQRLRHLVQHEKLRGLLIEVAHLS